MFLFRKLDIAIKYLFDSNVPLKKKLWLIIGIIYFILPIDFLPDVFLGLGFIDDFILVGYIISKISKDLYKYEKELKVKQKEEPFKDKIIENVDYKINDDMEDD